MNSVHVTRYTPDDQKRWNQQVRVSVNGTFLFEREYMDYHADRFIDHSLLIWDSPSRGQLMALLPAHEREGGLYSHQGLTFGGLLVTAQLTTGKMLDIIEAVITYCRINHLHSLTYKAIPHIYHQTPAEADVYALTWYGAVLKRRQLTSVCQPAEMVITKSRREGIRKSQKAGVTVREAGMDVLTRYWQLLTSSLQQRHNATPVHTDGEMRLLWSRFPNAIRLFVATLTDNSHADELLLGGVLIYDTPRCAKSQYIASSPQGRALGVIDSIFSELIMNVFHHKPYFDFGSSHQGEPSDSVPQLFAFEEGLLFQKEGFGARGVLVDTYTLHIADAPHV